ncbi:MAG: hypothetical protein A2653_02545 [Candidatus Zambryskibacteria bacterium RIFCSPHIGHO2_01_FULL_43_25]|nr:MAG: hypothetical protein A2653_02545 [Candidatus Zambryskibacteria bacterium RIFCSPHIGHO2_01_FULL_43_25]
MLRFSRFFRASVALLAVLVVSLSNLLTVSCTESGIGPFEPPDIEPPPDTTPQVKTLTVSFSFYVARPNLPTPGDITPPAGGEVCFWTDSSNECFPLPSSGKLSVTETYAEREFAGFSVNVPGFMKMKVDSIPRNRYSNAGAVLVPKEWLLTKGTFSGQVVQISMKKAFDLAMDNLTPNGTRTSFYYGWNMAQWGGTGWGYTLRSIRDVPILVAVSPDSSEVVASPEMIANIKAGINKVNEVLGEEMFKFVEWSSDFDHCNILTIILYGDSRGADSAPLTCGGNDRTNITGGIITLGAVRQAGFEDMLQAGIAHELFHVMGFGHTCAWRGIMSDYCGWNGYRWFTPEDVAYKEVMYRVLELQRQYNALWGIPEARAGEG